MGWVINTYIKQRQTSNNIINKEALETVEKIQKANYNYFIRYVIFFFFK